MTRKGPLREHIRMAFFRCRRGDNQGAKLSAYRHSSLRPEGLYKGIA